MAVTFQQQGSLDWIALVSNGANLSYQFLSRTCTAGIDVYTVIVGSDVCGNLLCGSEGRKRFIDALQRCRGLPGYRNVLWFGFGVRHIAYELSSTEQGATCAALCACLSECYSTDFAAEILMEMARTCKSADVTIPSLLQFRNLVRTCSGLVTNSMFAIRAEQLMRLVDDGKRPWQRYRGSAHKTELAQALLGLAKLSRGILSQMTIVGGADAGFIAAIADWLLDVDVEIRGGEDHTTRFRSANREGEPQLLVIYDKDGARDSIQCRGRTYRLANAYQTIRREDGHVRSAHLSGRLPWEKALKYTFGQDFDDLMTTDHPFGAAIGYAARMYKGIYEGDEDLPWEWLTGCRSYWAESFGLEYVHFTASRFSELETLRDAMGHGARTSTVKEAGINFDIEINTIASSCGCKDCCPSVPDPNQRSFCLVYLAHTIMVISRALSGMITEVCPMRSGLEEMYFKLKAESKQGQPTARDNMVEHPGQFWDSNQGTRVLLETADVIFSGDRIHDINYVKDWTCAMASNGLCYYLDVLVNPESDNHRAAKVHIIAGRIEHEGKSYDKLSDSDQGAPPLREGPEPKDFDERFLESLVKGHGGQLEVLVEERLDGLTIQYGLSKDSTMFITFGPSRGVHMMCRNEGLVRCNPSRCVGTPADIRQKVFLSLSTNEPFSRLKYNEEEHDLLVVHGSSITRLAVMANTWDPVIQRVQCLGCCTRHAISIGLKHITIIMGKYYIAAMKISEEKERIAAQGKKSTESN